MSQEYQKLQSLDESSVHINIQQERAQELSTDTSFQSNNTNQQFQGNQHSHSHSHNSGDTHTHSHGGKPCNSNHGRKQKSSHGHDHDHGAEGDSCNSQKKKNQDRFIQCFTMGMPMNCMILQYFWLNETLAGNNFEYYGSNILMFFIIIMCCITYYQAVTIKNTPTKRSPPPCDSSIVDPMQRNNQVCKSCNNTWKPMRAKHCRACGSCQLRMDHHCPWITNCVGLRNNRAFLLFTYYMAIGATQYVYKTFTYFQYLNVVDDFWQNGSFFYVYWAFTTVILIPITIMLIGLSIFHSFLCINNATTLDTMAGLSLGFPFTPQQKLPPNKRSVNLFNQGLIANVRDFFSGDIFLFWWPFTTYTPNDGTQYEMAPPCTFNDIQNIVQKQIVNEDGINLNQLAIDFDRRIEIEKDRLKECILQVDDKIFELWKDIQAEKDEAVKKEQEKLLKRINKEKLSGQNNQVEQTTIQSQSQEINNDKEITII